MRDRITQLIARYIGIGLIAVAAKLGATLSESDVKGACELIALGLVGLALLVVDHVMHRIQITKIWQAMIDTATTGGQAGGAGAPPTNGNGKV